MFCTCAVHLKTKNAAVLQMFTGTACASCDNKSRHQVSPPKAMQVCFCICVMQYFQMRIDN